MVCALHNSEWNSATTRQMSMRNGKESAVDSWPNVLRELVAAAGGDEQPCPATNGRADTEPRPDARQNAHGSLQCHGTEQHQQAPAEEPANPAAGILIVTHTSTPGVIQEKPSVAAVS